MGRLRAPMLRQKERGNVDGACRSDNEIAVVVTILESRGLKAGSTYNLYIACRSCRGESNSGGISLADLAIVVSLLQSDGTSRSGAIVFKLNYKLAKIKNTLRRRGYNKNA